MDCNDAYQKQFTDLGVSVLDNALKKWTEYLKANKSNDKDSESLKVISHIIWLGRKVDGAFFCSLNTTCGYAIDFKGPKDRKVAAYFIYNDISQAVEIPPSQFVY